MEKAFLISEQKIVTIREMIENHGNDGVRMFRYLCPDEVCRIKVYPSIPKQTKSYRLRAPGPYFSRRGKTGHKINCRVGMKSSRQAPIVFSIRNFGENVVSTITAAPAKFIEDPPKLIYRKKIVRRKTGRKKLGELEKGSWKRKYKYNQRTREVRELVRIYETHSVSDLQATPLKIPDSPATNYFDSFSAARFLKYKIDEARESSKLIYYGIIDFLQPVEEGLVVRLKNRTSDDRPLSVLILKTDAPDKIKKQQWERIKKAAAGMAATFYFLGRFRVDEAGDGLVLRADDLKKLWVVFPRDYANTRS